MPARRSSTNDGHVVELDRDFQGRTTLISFVFTRCPDRTLCPAISGKYAYLQARLDPRRFALVEITLDPHYDSPAVLRAYGEAFGAKSCVVVLADGHGIDDPASARRFSGSIRCALARATSFTATNSISLRRRAGSATLPIPAVGIPQAALAQARSIAGLSSNPFERFKLSLVASVVALCGGSQFAGIVLLELALFFVVLLLVAAGLVGSPGALGAAVELRGPPPATGLKGRSLV